MTRRRLAPKGTHLPAYRPGVACPKCGSKDVNAHHVAQECGDPECSACDQEHLCRTCQTCRYQWAEAPLDRVDLAGEHVDLMEQQAKEWADR